MSGTQIVLPQTLKPNYISRQYMRSGSIFNPLITSRFMMYQHGERLGHVHPSMVFLSKRSRTKEQSSLVSIKLEHLAAGNTTQ
jgi:hypothetical protein